MGVKLVSSGGGSVEINPPATASNFVATMPAGTGNVVVNGINGSIVSGTAVTASGTSVDFTGIPSWVKRITVMFSGVSTNGSSSNIIQIGAGSVETSGYSGSVAYFTTSAVATAASGTTGYQIANGFAGGQAISGQAVLTLVNGNVWVLGSTIGNSGGTAWVAGGTKTAGGTLDRVRITTVNGTDTFDAGSINILYE
jgi:hypothetical protein